MSAGKSVRSGLPEVICDPGAYALRRISSWRANLEASVFILTIAAGVLVAVHGCQRHGPHIGRPVFPIHAPRA